MKKVGTFIIAVALVLGLAQCKKEQPSSQVNEGETVQITLKVDGGDRHMVYPNTGAVLYTPGDVIHVGNDGRYVGSLTYEDGVFTGTLTSPHPNDHLHFYFVGGLSTGELTAGTTTSFPVDISDQSEKLPVLSYGQSTEPYSSEVSLYTSLLCNVGALVKFDLAASTANPVIVDDMLTTATINFGENPGISPTGTTGPITLYPESGTAKWAILLPNGSDIETSVTVDGTPYDVTVPAVAANEYVHGEDAVSIYNIPIDPYAFTVNAEGKKVYFAPGNLQYNPDIGGWRFAEHQWDFVGYFKNDEFPYGTVHYSDGISYNEGFNVGDYLGWLDLFGWGTWTGENPSPFNTLEFNSGDFVETVLFNDLNDEAGHPLSGDENWYTLSSDEWAYLLSEYQYDGVRHDKWGVAKISGVDYSEAWESIDVYGIVLVPDHWENPSTSDFFIPGIDVNEYSTDDWAVMETSGAVFLPFAGRRVFESEVFEIQDVNTCMHYWSKTECDGDDAYSVVYNPSLFVGAFVYNGNKVNGCAVRLVRDAE